MSERAKKIYGTSFCLILVVYTGFGFWLFPDWEGRFSLIGSVASILGVGYTVLQVLQTKAISKAAKEAVDDAITRRQSDEYREALQHARSLVREIRSSIDSPVSMAASIRLNDLNDTCIRIAHQQSERVDQRWLQFAEGASYYAGRCRDANAVFNLRDFDKWFQSLLSQIELELSPYSFNSDSTNV